MYSIQNLTKTTLKFQGIAIGPYMTISVGSIQDYVTLSRLSNSGKIRYFTTPTPKAVVAEKTEVAAKKVLKVEPVKEEVKVEVKEEIKEEVIEQPVKETPIAEEVKEEIKEEPVESITEETTVKPYTRKKRSNKK